MAFIGIVIATIILLGIIAAAIGAFVFSIITLVSAGLLIKSGSSLERKSKRLLIGKILLVISIMVLIPSGYFLWGIFM